MTSVKKVVKPDDEGTRRMFRTISTLKVSHAEFDKLSKLASSHQSAAVKYVESGRAMAEQLGKITQGMNKQLSDISEALSAVANAQKQIFDLQEQVNKVVLEELSQSVADAVNQERTAVTHFEKHYKQRHNQILSGLRKAEKDSAKAGKKSPYQLQTAIQMITDKMNEMQQHRKDKLEGILLMERKKYCDFLGMVCNTVDVQLKLHTEAKASLENGNANWRQLSGTSTNLSDENKRLLQSMAIPERTSTSIDSSSAPAAAQRPPPGPPMGGAAPGAVDEGYDEEGWDEGYDEGYDDEGYYEDENWDEGEAWNEGYEEGYEEEGAAAAGVFTARALYDYQGTHDYELNFRKGDIITVTEMDDASGWWTGELNGVVGPFPGNYVEQL